jgi:hypothetical protein
MAKSRAIEVFRAFDCGKSRQIGLSTEQVLRLCPRAVGPEWSIDSLVVAVGEAHGIVHNWDGVEHVHWQCPLCGRAHITDFVTHTDSNPALWLCEGGGPTEMCLVHWRRECDA